jgi:DNA-binding MarR family transcriptional regulator
MNEQASTYDVKEQLLEPVRALVDSALRNGLNADEIADGILHLLDTKHLVEYSSSKTVRLLNSHGRVLVAILEDPGITQRAIAQYLRVSESNINVSVNYLIREKLVTKTKVNNRNTYRFNAKEALKHPDISRLLSTIIPHVAQLAKGEV